jgi:hypothetical protein
MNAVVLVDIFFKMLCCNEKKSTIIVQKDFKNKLIESGS